MILYEQSTGKLRGTNSLLANAYSGNGEGLNNPALQDVHNVRPIPQGLWHMDELIEYDGEKGPHVIALSPCEGTETFGRSEFRIHGDNDLMNHSASEGCIVAPRFARDRAWEEEDKLLKVVE